MRRVAQTEATRTTVVVCFSCSRSIFLHGAFCGQRPFTYLCPLCASTVPK